jgi:histidyl-tRNA synthetase
MFKRVAGTRDILPREVHIWQAIEENSRRIFSLYNYQEIRPPILEEAALFSRSLGEFTEVVVKQMFLVKNNDELYALRPEGTASIVRAYLENNLDKTGGFTKLYYLGPMFRLERPQKGRLRQFHHIGCEVIGSSDSSVDVEVIALANHLLSSYGITGHTITINSLGCSSDKKAWVQDLSEHLRANLKFFCEDCQVRFNKNVLRILDCKNEACRDRLTQLNIRHGRLCPQCQDHFSAVQAGLTLLHIPYEISAHLVRGLDYYTRTVFEISHSALGSQDSLGAGGRYDNLVAELGGAPQAAIGFAFGMERLILAQNTQTPPKPSNLAYLIALGDPARSYSVTLLHQLRAAGICADTDYEDKSLKAAMRRANDLGARFVLIIGDDELKKGTVSLKDMATSQQREVTRQELLEILSVTH